VTPFADYLRRVAGPLLLLGVVGVIVACLFVPRAQGVQTQRSVHLGPPAPATATPNPDATVFLGVPRPSAQPSCAAGTVGFYADPNDCVYVCAGATNVLYAPNPAKPCVFSTP
jgi:hypothetical protein